MTDLEETDLLNRITDLKYTMSYKLKRLMDDHEKMCKLYKKTLVHLHTRPQDRTGKRPVDNRESSMMEKVAIEEVDHYLEIFTKKYERVKKDYEQCKRQMKTKEILDPEYVDDIYRIKFYLDKIKI